MYMRKNETKSMANFPTFFHFIPLFYFFTASIFDLKCLFYIEGHLPSKVIPHQSVSFIKGCLPSLVFIHYGSSSALLYQMSSRRFYNVPTPHTFLQTFLQASYQRQTDKKTKRQRDEQKKNIYRDTSSPSG